MTGMTAKTRPLTNLEKAEIARNEGLFFANLSNQLIEQALTVWDSGDTEGAYKIRHYAQRLLRRVVDEANRSGRFLTRA